VLAGQGWRSYLRSRATPRSYEGMVKDYYHLQPGYADCDVISAYILIMWGYDIDIGDIILNQRLTMFNGEHLEQLGSLSCLANVIGNCKEINEYRQLVKEVPKTIQGALKELEAQFFPS
ncbi:hypothetical protein ACET94_21855, partial [Aeromonas veronii]